MENFLTAGNHLASLNDESKIYSATGAGRIPWVSVQDIANVGFHALTSPQPLNTDLLILGPKLLTYDDVSQKPFYFFRVPKVLTFPCM